MFYLHSLKEPPPKHMCEAINFASEVEATTSSQNRSLQQSKDKLNSRRPAKL